MSEASSALYLLGMVIAIATVVLVGPVWLAARALGAKRRGPGASLLAALLAALSYQLVTTLLPTFAGVLLGVAGMALVYRKLLRMNFLSGLGVALVASLLQWLLLLSLAGVLAGPGAAGHGGGPAQVIEM